jgi:hypothetical protein
MARQARDASIRALLVDMAWKWIDLAEFDEWDNWERTLSLRAIQTKLGKALRAQYKLPEELPHRMLTLLMQIDASQDREPDARSQVAVSDNALAAEASSGTLNIYSPVS